MQVGPYLHRSRSRSVLGIWSLRILDRTTSEGGDNVHHPDSGRMDPVFPADWPHLSHCHCCRLLDPPPYEAVCESRSIDMSSAGFLRCFQHIAKFIDSALCPLSHDVLNPARVPL